MSDYAPSFGLSLKADDNPDINALIEEGMKQCLDDDAVVSLEEKASASWMTALLLVEINPERQNQVLTKGYQLGIVSQDFSIRNDGNAAFRISSLKYSTLHTDPAFVTLIERAKQEVSGN